MNRQEAVRALYDLGAHLFVFDVKRDPSDPVQKEYRFPTGWQINRSKLDDLLAAEHIGFRPNSLGLSVVDVDVKDGKDAPSRQRLGNDRVEKVMRWAGETPCVSRSPTHGAHLFYKTDDPKRAKVIVDGVIDVKLEIFGTSGFVELYDPPRLVKHLDALPVFAGGVSGSKPSSHTPDIADLFPEGYGGASRGIEEGDRNNGAFIRARMAAERDDNPREGIVKALKAAIDSGLPLEEAMNSVIGGTIAGFKGREDDPFEEPDPEDSTPIETGVTPTLAVKALADTADQGDLDVLEQWQAHRLPPPERPEYSDLPARRLPKGEDFNHVEEPTVGVDVAHRMAWHEGHDYRYLQDVRRWAFWEKEGWMIASAGDTNKIRANIIRFGSKHGNFFKYDKESGGNIPAAMEFRAGTGHAGNALKELPALHPIADEMARFDTNPKTIGLPEQMMIDARSHCEMRQQDPCDHLTKRTLVGMPGMHHPPEGIWRDAIETALPNPLERTYFQCWMGRALLLGGGKDMLWSPGERDTGKTTILNAITEAVGDYGTTIDPKLLLSNGEGDFTKDSARMNLRGARIVGMSELPSGFVVDNVAIKALVGRDYVTARERGGNTLVFKPTHSIWCVQNGLPEFSRMEGRDWESIVFLPFNEPVKGERRVGFSDVLVREDGANILSWLVEGARMVAERGMPPWSTRMRKVYEQVRKYDPIREYMKRYAGQRVRIKDIKEDLVALLIEAGAPEAQKISMARNLAPLQAYLRRKGYDIYSDGKNPAYVCIPVKG